MDPRAAKDCDIVFEVAEMQIIKEKTGKKPVLLLDDALSELDLLRKRTLLDKMIQIRHS
jgi:recombinational DNA repair ATPase RecF